jgi:hypothetical protein
MSDGQSEVAILGRSWQLSLPHSWAFLAQEDCYTLSSPDGVGALQLSFMRKANGDVSDRDLEEFAIEELDGLALDLVPYTAGDFVGLGVEFEDDGVLWAKWWLRAGRDLLFATYNRAVEDGAKSETVTVNQVLTSLRHR